ncbi:MAG: helix-turn-helix domain-containing protein [Lactobacillaceae bacterium]|nr:helix-turn-helix domain-containing protein [Lactobacillaceae bacterium]MCH4057086.1 helix-turn-helix domain-containing protein [Lactobacillaceae bacterium]MCH4057122.1 helix-turn-helix domain-containing protein [Lactobacillaceae bacterium]
MTKYSSTLKAEIVGKYNRHLFSVIDLAAQYQIPRRQIYLWIKQFEISGPNVLKLRKTKRKFSLEFKSSVINYYQTHEEALADVAAKYDLLPSQISLWQTAFIKDGIDALRPHPKGRSAKMKNKKQVRQVLAKNEVERLRQKLAEKDQELYDTKLERDILKKSLTLFGPSKDDEKHK